jgi:hypothetical protein
VKEKYKNIIPILIVFEIRTSASRQDFELGKLEEKKRKEKSSGQSKIGDGWLVC